MLDISLGFVIFHVCCSFDHNLSTTVDMDFKDLVGTLPIWNKYVLFSCLYQPRLLENYLIRFVMF